MRFLFVTVADSFVNGATPYEGRLVRDRHSVHTNLRSLQKVLRGHPFQKKLWPICNGLFVRGADPKAVGYTRIDVKLGRNMQASEGKIVLSQTL